MPCSRWWPPSASSIPPMVIYIYSTFRSNSVLRSCVISSNEKKKSTRKWYAIWKFFLKFMFIKITRIWIAWDGIIVISWKNGGKRIVSRNLLGLNQLTERINLSVYDRSRRDQFETIEWQKRVTTRCNKSGGINPDGGNLTIEVTSEARISIIYPLKRNYIKSGSITTATNKFIIESVLNK